MRPGKSHEARLFRSLLSDQRPPRSIAGQLGLTARAVRIETAISRPDIWPTNFRQPQAIRTINERQ